jgi:hypothetical protein
MEVIVPAAGLSTRFPNLRPKYTLTDYKGRIMLHSALEPYLDKYKINVGILQEHDEKFQVKQILKHEFGNAINIITLPEQTKGPADTAYQMLAKIKNKKKDILIKDCDSFFDHKICDGNYICVTSFADHEAVRQAHAKSYVIANDQNIVQTIAEKKVISEFFCVGGYKFASGDAFIRSYEALANSKNEIFVSNIIQNCLNNKEIFCINKVQNYIDVGTVQEWQKFNDKSVIFCDIDGTIIKAQAKGSYKEDPTPLQSNLEKIKLLEKQNNQIIFVTARPEKERKDTLRMLKKLGFVNPNLIMGLLNCKRVVINDYNDANPYPRSVAINLMRDIDHLKDFTI